MCFFNYRRGKHDYTSRCISWIQALRVSSPGIPRAINFPFVVSTKRELCFPKRVARDGQTTPYEGVLYYQGSVRDQGLHMVILATRSSCRCKTPKTIPLRNYEDTSFG